MFRRSIVAAVSALAVLLVSTSSTAQDRKTLYITPTSDSFETYLAAAMLKKAVPVTVVTKEEGARSF